MEGERPREPLSIMRLAGTLALHREICILQNTREKNLFFAEMDAGVD